MVIFQFSIVFWFVFLDLPIKNWWFSIVFRDSLPEGFPWGKPVFTLEGSVWWTAPTIHWFIMIYEYVPINQWIVGWIYDNNDNNDLWWFYSNGLNMGIFRIHHSQTHPNLANLASALSLASALRPVLLAQPTDHCQLPWHSVTFGNHGLVVTTPW